MAVEIHHERSHPVRHCLYEVRLIVQGQAQPLHRHDLRQVLKHPAGVARHQPHPLGQVGVNVLECEKVHVAYRWPRIALEVLPALNGAVMLIEPRALLAGTGRRVRGQDLPDVETQSPLIAHKVIAHPVPEGNEIVKVCTLRRSIAAIAPRAPQQLCDDRSHHHLVDEVLYQWDPVPLHASHQQVNEPSRIWLGVPQRHATQYICHVFPPISSALLFRKPSAGYLCPWASTDVAISCGLGKSHARREMNTHPGLRLGRGHVEKGIAV